MTLEEKAAICSGRDFWHTKAIERLGIPSVMMCDGPHGLRKQSGAGDHLGIQESIETVCYPTASALASSFDRDILRQLGEALGQECQSENVGMLLGPGLNIKRSPLCGRNFEYFSEDPYLAGELGAAYIQSLQNKGVAACVKHFACNNQETMRMAGSSQVDERTLHEIYLPAFEAAVKKGGVRGVMCAYNAVNGVFCAENELLLTDILRDRWGFDGFVVTDWGAVKDRAKGVASSLDLEMPGGPHATGEALVKAVNDGTLSEEALDKAASRVVQFVMETAAQRDENAVLDRDACRRLSRKIAGECAVLLKNDGVLPLSKEAKVVFIGEFAAQPRYQGAGSSHINVPHAVSAVEAAEGLHVTYVQGYDAHEVTPDKAKMAEAVLAAADADAAILFVGLPNTFETEGCDRDDLSMPENQNALIHAVAAANPNTVVVLHGGAPMELPWFGEVPAVLTMHLGGDCVGAAAVDLLFGDGNPSGHLAETWPMKLADNPSYLNFPGEDGVVEYGEGIFVGYRYYDKKQMEVRFPFGYGLSYTSFDYTNISVDKDSIPENETVRVTCNVTNAGHRKGKAVVQLYVRDVESSVRRPVRELKGFEKVELAPGETAAVAFTLDRRAFAYYEPRCHDWFVERGEFVLEIGENCRDIRTSIRVHVESSQGLPMAITANTTVGQLMRHPKGAAFIQNMLAQAPKTANAGNLGEGSEKMVRKTMLEMPLGAMVSYGRMTPEQLDGLITMQNT